VRHSRRPDGAVIVYTREEWQAFIAGVKEGEFDFAEWPRARLSRAAGKRGDLWAW